RGLRRGRRRRPGLLRDHQRDPGALRGGRPHRPGAGRRLTAPPAPVIGPRRPGSCAARTPGTGPEVGRDEAGPGRRTRRGRPVAGPVPAARTGPEPVLPPGPGAIRAPEPLRRRAERRAPRGRGPFAIEPRALPGPPGSPARVETGGPPFPGPLGAAPTGRRAGRGRQRRARRRQGALRPPPASRPAGRRCRSGRAGPAPAALSRRRPGGGPAHPRAPTRRPPRTAGPHPTRRPMSDATPAGEAAGHETILVERTGRTAVITLNRPEALNALNLRLMEEAVAASEG